eukprot:362925-Chlamydomonas_euryale.AAC.3
MTVGSWRPVSSFICESSSARLMIGASTCCASTPYCDASELYCSMYSRMVAPEEPVPDSRKMMREPSA